MAQQFSTDEQHIIEVARTFRQGVFSDSQLGQFLRTGMSDDCIAIANAIETLVAKDVFIREGGFERAVGRKTWSYQLRRQYR